MFKIEEDKIIYLGTYLKILIILSSLSLLLLGDMSIQEAWNNAEIENKGIKSSSSDITRAELKKSSAESMYLPSISISGSYTYLNKPINIDTSAQSKILASLPVPIIFPTQIDLSEQNMFLADLHLLWPLYVGGRIDATQDIYTAQIGEKKAITQMKKDTEFLKIVKYYYGVVVSESLYKTRLEAQKALRLHYENAKKLQVQGQIATIELLNAEVKLDAAKIETSKAKHKLEIVSSALYLLTKLTQHPSSKLFVNENIKDEDYYKKEMRENYAGLKVLDAKATQSASLVEIKEAAWMPEISAYGNFNLYKDDSPLMSTLPTWFAGVMVKINLLQRKDRSDEVEAAKLLNEKLKYAKAEAVDSLALLVEKTYKEMIADQEEFNSLNSSLHLARENYRLRTVAFKEGLSTSVELVDAQLFLMSVKMKRLNSAYDFVQKVSQLSVLSGDRDMFFQIEQLSEGIK